MSRDFVGALLQLNAEKNIPREQLIHTVEDAIQSAYRRVAPGNENVCVEVDAETGRIRVYRAMHVVDEVEDPTIEFTIEEARTFKADARLGELIETEEMDASSFGRIHAQTAKQVVLQRLREAEREQVFGQYAQREGEIITGTVNRVEPRAIILDVGRAEAILATTEQSAMEHYRIGQHVKAYVLEVRRTTKGPQIFVSRTHKGFLRRLFELEVPEIHAGTVEIKAIAREAGTRSKVAVSSRQEGLDPVGATVGQRGGRVQAVVAELGGEKIDVIEWHEDPAVFVAKALSPAQVVGVDIDEENRIASVTVPERMLSLAIGREGQNARLAAKLTGWRIDIRSDTPSQPRPTEVAPPAEVEPQADAEPQGEAVAVGAEPAVPAAPRAKRGKAVAQPSESAAEVTSVEAPAAGGGAPAASEEAPTASEASVAAEAAAVAGPGAAPVKRTRRAKAAATAPDDAAAPAAESPTPPAASDGEQAAAEQPAPKRRRAKAPAAEEVTS